MRTPRTVAGLAATTLLAGTAALVVTTARADHPNPVEQAAAELTIGGQWAPVEEPAAEISTVDVAAVTGPGAEPAASALPTGDDAHLAPSMAALRHCESGGDYGIDTGNDYYGAYQFDALTWSGLGYGGWPHEAPPEVQDEAAVALYNSRGWAPWPDCSSSLGLH